MKADATWNQSGTEDIALQNIQARSRSLFQELVFARFAFCFVSFLDLSWTL